MVSRRCQRCYYVFLVDVVHSSFVIVDVLLSSLSMLFIHFSFIFSSSSTLSSYRRFYLVHAFLVIVDVVILSESRPFAFPLRHC